MCLAMAGKGFVLLVLVVLHATTFVCAESVLAQKARSISRPDFPDGFVFGAATSAYQVEGAANEDGKGPSIWDTFTHKHPEKIKDHSNGDVATDSYHRYKEDVALLAGIEGMDAYKFSISWSRILPYGTISGGINKAGIEHYNNLINEVISKGLKPYATLFHHDTPQFLEDIYGGFLSKEIVEDFKNFATICFWEFGDRVKHWITLNGPWVFSTYGYASGTFAPGRCSSWEAGNCSVGDSGTEPYNVTHNLLLAHAAAVQVYRTEFQEDQKGSIGITLSSHWFLPFNSKFSGDALAARLALDFMFGWYMDPLTSGEYPPSMRAIVGNRLPNFTEEDSRLVKGSFDFIGINYYTSRVARLATPDPTKLSYNTDSHAVLTAEHFGVPIGPQATGSTWIYVYPQGLLKLLNHIRVKYNNPVIYITENGVGDLNNVAHPTPEALNDTLRIESYLGHLESVYDAIRSGADVRGFFAWSLLDNFEWSDGFTTRFGLYFVDYENDLKRTPKRSVEIWKEFLNPQKSSVFKK